MERKNKRILWELALPVLLYVALAMAIQAGLELCFFEFFTAPEHQVLELALVNAIEIPFFYSLYRKEKQDSQRQLQRTGRILLAMLGGILLARSFNLLIGLTPLPSLFPGYETTAESMYTGSLLSLVAASVVTAPILEELLVRGILYPNLKKALQNRYAAMVCASLLFGILHGSLVQGLFAFLLGLYLNWIYESCRSLTAAILVHSSVNAVAVFLDRYTAWENVLSGSLPLYLALTAICLLAGIYIWRKFPLPEET